MKSTHFTVKYDGTALQQHEMDVAVLAPALMAMSQLVKEISLLQSHGEYTATLHVKGNIKAGSIEVELSLHAQSIFQQVKDMFASETATAIANFGGILGLLAMIYALIKKYQGRSPDKIEPTNEGNVILHFHQHQEIINTIVYKIYTNYNLRQSIYETVKPLEQQGIDEFRMSQDGKTIIEIDEQDVLSFIPNNVNIPLNEHIQETILVIESITFKEKNKWAFFDGNSSIRANISDEVFLHEVDNGKRFAKGDWLKVLLKKVQAEENGKLKTSYEIVKVIEHIIKEQHDLFR